MTYAETMTSEWDLQITVELTEFARRAVAKKLGLKGEVSHEHFQEVAARMIEQFVTESLETMRD